MKKKHLMIIAAVLLCIVLGINLVPLNKQQGVKSMESGVVIGKKAPVFTLNSLTGSAITVGQQSKVTILNFWATWCPPCREEMPELSLFYNQHKGNVNFYAINIKESAIKIETYMNNHGLVLPILLDQDGSIAGMFQVSAIPTTVIIDEMGIIQYRKSGSITKAELEAALSNRHRN